MTPTQTQTWITETEITKRALKLYREALAKEWRDSAQILLISSEAAQEYRDAIAMTDKLIAKTNDKPGKTGE